MGDVVAVDSNSYRQLQPRSNRQLQPRSVDEAIAALAARQHGVVSRPQLRRLGLRPTGVDYRVKIGRLHGVYRGVYAVGHSSLSLDGRRIAAVLACGDDAALSHRDGAALHAIRQCNRRVYEITVPRKQRARRGIQLHAAALPADEVTSVRGIPVTTVPRTLLDLAAILPRRDVEMAFHEAEVRRLHDRLSLDDMVARHPRHRGAATIAAVLGDVRDGLEVTKETIVALFTDVLDGAGLPRPLLNRWICGYECDCVWPSRRAVVELDGYAVHGTRRNFESDRERDRVLHANRWVVVRVTWRQLRDDAAAVARDLAALVA